MTKSRKRILLSSIAMLLVALVALGSATFAWFSVSKTVTADSIEVKAIAAAGLEISKTSATSGFGTTVSFTDVTASIKPVSWAPTAAATGHGFIPNANIEPTGGAYGATTAGSWTDTNVTPDLSANGSNDTGYFSTYRVWIRSASDGTKRATHNVSASVVVDGDNKTFARAYLIDGTTANNSAPFSYNNEAVSGVTNTAGTKSTAVTPTTSKTVSDTTAYDSATETDAGQLYTLVVWFDGEDSDCIDGAKDKNANFTITFTATDM